MMNRKQWMMAALLSVGTMATMSAQTGAPMNTKDDLFAGTEIFAKGATDVSEISMDPASLDLVNGKPGKRAHGMVLNVVHSYSYDKPGMYNIADVETFRNKLNTGDWHCSVHTRNMKSGSSTDICEKQRTDGLKERAIITVEPRELTFIHTIQHEGGGDSMLMLPGMGDLTTLAMLDHFEMPPMPPMPNINVNLSGLKDSIRLEMKNLHPMSDEDMKRVMRDAQRAVADAQRSLSEEQRARDESDEPKQPKQPE